MGPAVNKNVQSGASLIIALFLLLAMTLISVSLSRVTRAVLAATGSVSQEGVLLSATDQGIGLAKANMAAISGMLEAHATTQAWFNSGTSDPTATFWQTCSSSPDTANSCETQTILISGQQIVIKYMVQGTGLTHALSISGAAGQVTAAFYKVFVNATTADGATQTTEAWYLRM